MSRTGLWSATAATGILHAAVLVLPLHFDEASAAKPEVAAVFRFQTLPPLEPEPEPVEPEPQEPIEPEPDPETPPPEPPPPVPRRAPKPAAPSPTEIEPTPPEPAPPSEAAPPIEAPEVPETAEAPPDIAEVAVPRKAPEPSSRPPATRGNPNYRGWATGVHAAFMRHRHYPPAALRLGLEGTAKVRVHVDRSGRLLGTPELVESSGHAVLDEEALRAAQAAAPFDPLPEGTPTEEKSFVIPIAFRIVQEHR